MARPARRRTLTATYYDTPDLRLARHQITLRRRTGGADDGWHLKLPAGHEHTRDELHLPLATPGDPPLELVWMVMAFTRGAVLAPVATVVNHRHPWRVTDPAGRALAEITDDHVDVERYGEPRASFREVEVEAAADRSHAELADLVSALIAGGARPGSFASKAVRALGAAALLPRDVDAVNPPLPAPAATTHDSLRMLVGRWQTADLGLRRDLPNARADLAEVVANVCFLLTRANGPYDPAWAAALRREVGGVEEVLAGGGDTTELRLLLREPRYVALLDRLIQAAQAPLLVG